MGIHILGQSNGDDGSPQDPIDAEALSAEFQAGQELFMEVPLSQTHQACLVLAAQRTLYQQDCSHPVRAVLLQFLGWCSQHSDFGSETRKLIAAQGAELRLRAGVDANGVQTSGQCASVEEDGDEIFTPMPRSCQRFACREHHLKLENRNGFMCCPRCGVSYGAVPKSHG